MNNFTKTLSSYDLFLELEAFSEGRSIHAWRVFGAHAIEQNCEDGYIFRVWAPNARSISVFGDFNNWNATEYPMNRLEGGIWERFISGLKQFDTYKYAVTGPDGQMHAKADPYALHSETRPGNASKLYELDDYHWGDAAWIKKREKTPPYHRPMNIYECELGSWRKTGENTYLSYHDIADLLVPYVTDLGVTHVELLPLTEYPYDGSWGYQCTGYFAATSRFGTPDGLQYLIDKLHQAGIGVILDWVPAHFPRDEFGLYHFDGTPTYEYSDPRKGENAGWGTNVFDFGRNEVRSFLGSSALFWLEQFHVDGLRVDAVSSILYLNYGREDGQWIPNQFGGQENLEAIEFFRNLNTKIFANVPNALMIAEEATAFPKVTHPVSEGGLGFNFKWNMGWMNDMCHYLKMDPYFRQHHHKDITFSLMYAFSENYILPISHDEVVHMKGSLFDKMPGDDAMRFAGVRSFYAYMMSHPGKKLMFMGAELGQWNEWHYEHSLDWHLLEDNEANRQNLHFFQTINNLYKNTPALWEQDDSWDGFQWLSANDHTANTVAFYRCDKADKVVVVVCNLSPENRNGYRLGVPFAGTYGEILNTDSAEFGGKDNCNFAPLKTEPIPCHEQAHSFEINLPPMSAVMFRCTRRAPVRKAKAPEPAKQKTLRRPKTQKN